MNAAERRSEIIDIILEEHGTTTSRLAVYFGVSRRTIMNDIQWLSTRYPIYTDLGRNGGIRLTEGYDTKKKYLTDVQTEVLKGIIPKHEGVEADLLKYILKTYGVRKRAS